MDRYSHVIFPVPLNDLSVILLQDQIARGPSNKFMHTCRNILGTRSRSYTLSLVRAKQKSGSVFFTQACGVRRISGVNRLALCK